MKRFIFLPWFWVVFSAFAPPPAPVFTPPIADSWIFPLGGDGAGYAPRQNLKYGALIENTAYATRNLDLVMGADNITCFGVGAHRLFNAGVDLYRVGDATAGAEVRAVANGVVSSLGSNYPGAVVVLSHTLPNSTTLYSLYGHLTLSMPLTVGSVVSQGAVLGAVLPLTYTGNFPELHPDGEHSHLHFEIRNFADATALGLPAACNAQAGPAGVGYTYPNPPNSYGYLDPLNFLRGQVPLNRVYLPITYGANTTTCQDGQNLAQNGGFETGSLVDTPPWVQVSTRYSWNTPLVSTTTAYQGLYGARFGGWDNGLKVDEELRQKLSLPLPVGTVSVTWVTFLKLVPDTTPVDADDRFVFTLEDAFTGQNLLSGEGIVLNDLAIPPNAWGSLRARIFNMSHLAGRNINLRLSALSDETRATLLAADEVELITHCATTGDPPAVNETGVEWEWVPLP